MKPYRKPLIALLCLAVTLICACGPLRPSAVALGRFVETDITPAGSSDFGAESILVHSDGSIHYVVAKGNFVGDIFGEYRQSETIVLSSADGAAWQQTDGWRAALDQEPQAVSVAEDGTVFAATIQSGGSTADPSYLAKIYRISPDGQASALCSVDLEPRSRLQLLALQRQRLLFTVEDQRGSHTLLLDAATGNKVADLGWRTTSTLAANQDIVVCAGSDGLVAAFRLEDGQPAPGYATGFGAQEPVLGLTLDTAGNLYFLSSRGISKQAPDGQVVETIMESGMFSFGSPVNFPRTVQIHPSGSMFIAYNSNDSGSKLMRYDYDPTMPTFPEKELVVYSLRQHDGIRATAALFQQAYPEVRVNYEVGLQSGDNLSAVEDALRVLNTDLLAGNGPDLLILDGMPLQSYVEKGMLADLRDLVTTEQLLGVATSLATDEGLHAISTRVILPALFGPTQLLDRIDSLGSLVQQIQQHGGHDQAGLPLFCFTDLRSLFDFLYRTSAPALLDQGGIDQENLATFLEAAKAIADKYQLQRRAADYQSYGNNTREIMAYMASPAEALMGSRLLTYPGVVAGALSGKMEASAAVAPGLVPQAFLPSMTAGISARSQQPELAAAFINTMLGEEAQGLQYDGVPVRAAMIRQAMQVAAEKTREIMHTTVPEVDLVAMVEQLTTPVLIDDSLAEQFYQGMEDYCLGKQALPEAISSIEQATELYLAEQR